LYKDSTLFEPQEIPMPGPSFDLTGRTALVTGGGSGLGLAMAEGLAAAGARVIIVGRDREKLERAKDAIGAAAFAVCDLLDRAAIAPLVASVEREHGPLDILVNNAGIQHRAPVQDFPEEAWDRMIATHLSAPFFLAQRVAAGMIERKRGKIINTLSLTSDLGRPTIVPYAAAKGGLRMLTRGLAVELGPHNIQVNGIGPGYFRTELNRALMDNPEFDAWVKKRTPAGRWGDPSELAGAAVYLASSAADYVNGQVIYVDGGFTASM
jgi:gluconate 5-dehydrogenase